MGGGVGNGKLDGKIKDLIPRSVDICDTDLIIRTHFTEKKEKNHNVLR